VKETFFVERARAEKKSVERRDWFDIDSASFDYLWYDIFNCVTVHKRNI